MKIRDFIDRDIEIFIEIRNQAAPAEPTSAEQFRKAPKEGHYLRTFELDGKPRGFGVLRPWPFGGGPGRWALSVFVHENFRRQGLGRQLYEDLCEEANRRGWESLRAGYYESSQGAAGFAAAQGFSVWLREDAFSLNLDRDFAADLETARARLKVDGIKFTTFDRFENPDKERLFYELCLPIFRQVPEMADDPDPDFEPFLKNNLRPLSLHESTLFLAVKDGKLLGYTQHRLPEGGQPFIHMTGIVPDYQRMGIARCLKIYSQVEQKSQGYEKINTGSAEGNVGMQALNRELGFYVSDGYLFVKRDREVAVPEKE